MDKTHFIVPNYYSNLNNNQFEVGQNIIGQDITNLGYNMNYLVGNGSYQLPCHYSALNYIATPGYYRSRYKPKLWSNVHDRFWTYSVSSSVGGGYYQIIISSSVNSLTARSLPLVEGVNHFMFKENCYYTGTNYTDDEIMIQVNFAGNAMTTPTLARNLVSLFNAPTRYLNPTAAANQIAVDNVSTTPYKPIFTTPSNENSSIGAIPKALNYVSSSIVKGIHTLSTPYEYYSGVGSPTTLYGIGILDTYLKISDSSTFELAFATAHNITQTYKSVFCDIYCGVSSSGDTGVFQITTSVGTAEIQFTNTTPSWQTVQVNMQTDTPSNMFNILANTVDGITGNMTYRLTKIGSADTAKSVCVWTIQLYELLLG